MALSIQDQALVRKAAEQGLGVGAAATTAANTAITASALAPATPAAIPTAPVSTVNPSASTGMNAQIAANTQTLTQAQLDAQNAATGKTQQNDPLTALFDKYLGSISAPAATPVPQEADQSALNAAKQAQLDAQAKLAGVNNRITGLTATADAAIASLQGTATGELGRRIDTTDISRNLAIQQMPLQIEALTAQAGVAAAQGNTALAQDALNQAQSHLDTIYNVQQKDAENAYNFKLKIADAVYNFATEQQKSVLDTLKTKKAEDFQLKTLEIKNKYDVEAAKIKALQPNFQFVSGTDNQVSGVFDTTTGKFTARGDGGGGSGVTPSGTVGGYAAGSPEAKQYQTALSTILGSGKFTKDQAKAVTNAINNGEDPFTVVKNQAKTLLGQTGDTKLTSYEVAREQLTAVKDSLTKYYALGGKTNIFSGNYEKVINKLGEVNDPKLVSIAVEIASSLQIYRNAVSGTAYSVQEGVDIATIFPGINKSQGLNTAILEGRAKAFDSTIDSTYRSVLGKSYDELKTLNTPTPPPAPPPPETPAVKGFWERFGNFLWGND